MLGPFRLLRPLGRGSMGVVHLAQDVASGQHVAVKCLALGHEFSAEEHDEARARFLAEVATAKKRLAHPDIVTVLAATASTTAGSGWRWSCSAAATWGATPTCRGCCPNPWC
ncbi:MAG: hypothetical protein U5L74_05330 [Ideonella sp.]|nr:hypothetical protein [Ideonella sp.]